MRSKTGMADLLLWMAYVTFAFIRRYWYVYWIHLVINTIWLCVASGNYHNLIHTCNGVYHWFTIDLRYLVDNRIRQFDVEHLSNSTIRGSRGDLQYSRAVLRYRLTYARTQLLSILMLYADCLIWQSRNINCVIQCHITAINNVTITISFGWIVLMYDLIRPCVQLFQLFPVRFDSMYVVVLRMQTVQTLTNILWLWPCTILQFLNLNLLNYCW